MKPSFRNLLTGYDTIECAYYLRGINPNIKFDYDGLIAKRDMLKQKKAKSEVLCLGTEEFLLASHGTSSGYPVLLKNELFSIQCGELNKPNFYVTYSSFALWHHGIENLHQQFLAWAHSVGLEPCANERLSRVDATFDYYLPVIDFDQDSFVTVAEKDGQWRSGRKVETFSIGRSPLILRIYNKSAEIENVSQKTWFYDLWGQKENVWRIEWEIRKEPLRNVGIITLSDLQERQGDLLRNLAQNHTSLRRRTKDSNVSRWPLHSLWKDVLAQIKQMNALGVVREYLPEKGFEERLAFISISLYGYLKRVAAINCLQSDTATGNVEETLEFLSHRMLKIHDPLTWRADVTKRMDEMRLGEW